MFLLHQNSPAEAVKKLQPRRVDCPDGRQPDGLLAEMPFDVVGHLLESPFNRR